MTRTLLVIRVVYKAEDMRLHHYTGWLRRNFPADSKLSLNRARVLVQPEVERGRHPLVSIPPLQAHCSSTTFVRLNYRVRMARHHTQRPASAWGCISVKW